MNKRPIAVTVVAILLLLAGVAGIAHDYVDSHSLSANHFESVWIAALNLLGIAGAVFLLRGQNWARWLAIGWMAFHVAISFLNAWQQVVMHGLILALFVLVLFRRDARAYFGSGRTSTQG